MPRRCRGKRGDWEDFDGSYSRSGRLIAYTHYDNCDRRVRNGIYVMKANGRHRRLLIADRRGWHAFWPAFSPNDRAIAFEGDRGSLDTAYTKAAVYKAAAKPGRKPVRVDPSNGAYEYAPSWSATNRLAMETLTHAAPIPSVPDFTIDEVQITTLAPPFPANGATARRRLTFSYFDDETPDWSPDGKRLVFGRSNTNLDQPVSSVWEMAADGSHPRRLTRNLHAWAAVWSPDGRQIAYVRERQTKPNLLYVMRADGSHRRRLTSLVDTNRLSWQPLPVRNRP